MKEIGMDYYVHADFIFADFADRYKVLRPSNHNL